MPNVTESEVVSSPAVSSSCSDWEASSTWFVLLEVVLRALVLGPSVHLLASTSSSTESAEKEVYVASLMISLCLFKTALIAESSKGAT